MAVSTLTSGTLTVPYIPMTTSILECPPPILETDFEGCRIPGGADFWASDGFYSPGQCFAGYRAACTQTAPRWPVEPGETAVRCIPIGFDCNDENPRFATTVFGGTTLSAPAFEIRWRSEDLGSTGMSLPAPVTTSSTLPNSEPPDPTADGGPFSTATPTSSSQSSETTSSLPTASIAGIAVGTSLGMLSMVLSIIFIIFRRRKRMEAVLPTTHDPPRERRLDEEQPPVELADQRCEPKELAVDASTMRGGSNSHTGEVEGDERAASHVSLNRIPIEMPAEPSERPMRGIDEPLT